MRRGFAISAALLLAALLIFNVDVLADRIRGFVDVTALVSGTSGVRIGSEVWVEGIRAGRVTGVSFIGHGEETLVALDLRLRSDARDVVRTDSRAYTTRRRFVGQPVVWIGAGTAAGRPIEDGDTLPPDHRPDLVELLQRGTEFPAAMDSFRTAVGGLHDAAARRGPGFLRLTGRLADLSGEAADLADRLQGGSVGLLLDDPELGRRLARLRDRAASLDSALAGLGRYTGDEMAPRLDALAARTATLDRELARLQDALQGNGTLGRLAADSALMVAVGRVRAQVDSLRAEGLGFALRMLRP